MLPAPASSSGCRLVGADGRALPLRSVDVSVDAGHGLARTTLRQVFANPFAEPLRVTYLLPLPADGAVTGFAFTLGGERFTGRVERREDARRAFEQALLEGRSAAILEQDRSALFTQELGNVPPGAAVEVELEVEQPLAWVSGGWEWRFPTVVGPRFQGEPGRVPDADRQVVDVAPTVAVTARARVLVRDACTGAATSPSHTLWHGDGGLQLVGDLDRDLVLRWPVAQPEPGVGIETARRAGDPDAYALVTIVPPAVASSIVRRDLCLLLDTSGSMGGAPLRQLVAFSSALVQGLRDGDQLEMIEFSSQPTRWKPRPVTVDASSRAAALGWLGALRAGGGTQMHTAVAEALAPLSAEAQRQVVLMTDGYIGFEQEVIGRVVRALPAGARLHVVGVGSAVNRTLTSGAARAGGGVEVVVGVDEALDEPVARLLARTGDPVWIDVTISGSAVRGVAPACTRDLLARAPARLAVRLDPRGGELVLRARGAGGSVERRIPVVPVLEGTGRDVVSTRFARERVEDLETAVAGGADGASADAEIESLGLRYQLATRRTSWVAVSASITVDPGDPTRRVVQPHLLPHGVSAEGVGLGRSQAVATTLAAPSIAPLGAPGGAAPPPPPASAPKSMGRRARAMDADDEAPSAPVAAGPPAPPARLRDEAPKRKAEATTESPAPLREEQARRPAPATPLRARVVRLADGLLVLELTADAGWDWRPREVDAIAADGSERRLEPLSGTTREGAVRGGASVRLVVAWNGPAPTSLRLGGRVVTVS